MTKYTCPKCLGAKVISAFSHIEHGTCFTCAGAGFLTTKPKEKGATYLLSFLERDSGKRVVVFGVVAKNAAAALKKGNAKANPKFFLEGSAAIATAEEVEACKEAA